MRLAEIEVAIPVGLVGAADEVLLDAGAMEWSVQEDAIAGTARLVGVFPDEAGARVSWLALVPVLAAAGVQPLREPCVRVLPDSEWRDSYKAHFKAWHFGRLHWVPVWERESFALPSGDAVLWLDPGMAFGTGNHETTRLVVERLVEWDLLRRGAGQAGWRVVDAGCGSGILALSAARLGYRNVKGFDVDADALRVSRENAEMNGLAEAVEFFVADLDGGLRGEKADLLMANIQADVLMRSARVLADAVAPGGALVLSGILSRELREVQSEFQKHCGGWQCDSRTLGEWSDLKVSCRPDPATLKT